jgi:hypothetical protein
LDLGNSHSRIVPQAGGWGYFLLGLPALTLPQFSIALELGRRKKLSNRFSRRGWRLGEFFGVAAAGLGAVGAVRRKKCRLNVVRLAP